MDLLVIHCALSCIGNSVFVQLNEEEQTEGDQPDQDVSPNVCPERKEVLEIDTSPAKLLTFLQTSCKGEQAVSGRAVDGSDQSSQSNVGASVSEDCAQKM